MSEFQKAWAEATAEDERDAQATAEMDSKIVDVRDTDKAEAAFLGLQGQCCKISHLMAMHRFLSTGRPLPEGVDVIRPVEYPQ
jgi:hypothetical protein